MAMLLWWLCGLTGSRCWSVYEREDDRANLETLVLLWLELDGAVAVRYHRLAEAALHGICMPAAEFRQGEVILSLSLT